MKQWCLNGLEINIIGIKTKQSQIWEKNIDGRWSFAQPWQSQSEKGNNVLKVMWNRSTKKNAKAIKILSKPKEQAAKKSLKKFTNKMKMLWKLGLARRRAQWR